MTKFCIYESDRKGKNMRPAKFPECQVLPSWNKSEYDTLAEAIAYTLKWLGAYAPYAETLENEFVLNGIIKWDYSGMEDYIVIQKETKGE